MHTVSGSLSLAVRRSFHRSLTVLSTIGHEFVFSLGGWSPQIQPGFLVPRPTRVPDQLMYSDFAYGTLTPSGPPFQARSAISSAVHRQRPPLRPPGAPRGLGLGIELTRCDRGVRHRQAGAGTTGWGRRGSGATS